MSDQHAITCKDPWPKTGSFDILCVCGGCIIEHDGLTKWSIKWLMQRYPEVSMASDTYCFGTLLVEVEVAGEVLTADTFSEAIALCERDMAWQREMGFA